MNTETLELRLPNGFVNIDRLRELKSLIEKYGDGYAYITNCLLYTSPSPRDRGCSRMPSSA